MQATINATSHLNRIQTPLGEYMITVTEKGLAAVAPAPSPGGSKASLVHEAAQQLEEYFEGRRREFTVPLDLRGTAFQRRVWEALLRIPYGETRSYAWVAREVGMPGAARAVGGAVGSNPIAIVVPCHRVVGADGSLTGYAGGLERKVWLLAMERST